jgi:hypothetical protein
VGTDRRLSLVHLSGVAILAGVLYNSWPLGYWLNPAVAGRGLASEFEGRGQPYAWLFVAGDVLAGLLVLLLCGLLSRRTNTRGPAAQQDGRAAAITGLAVFGVGTIIDALLPMGCEPSLQRCPSFTQDHLLLLHGMFSIGAALGLFISLLALWWHDRRSRLLNGLLAAYVLFGLFSLIDALQPTHHNWSQHYYLLLCGVWLAMVPYAFRRADDRP